MFIGRERGKERERVSVCECGGSPKLGVKSPKIKGGERGKINRG